MKTTALKKKLKDDFEKILEDESKLKKLETVFTEIISEEKTSTKIQDSKEEESKKYTAALKSEVKSWDDFQKKMKAKYGF